MLLSGVWHLCDDGVTRPVLRGEILAADGTWVQARFLMDVGADRTVLIANCAIKANARSVDFSPHEGGSVD
jgi:hypothetical protein